MKLNVSTKIVYCELVIIAIIYITLIPYLITIMDFTPLQLFHYLIVTMFILTPLGIASAFYFINRWECRPIKMLMFYLERSLEPPDDILVAAKIRALNLPLVHALSVLIRYEIVALLVCLYMGTIGDLPLSENIRLGTYAAVGLSIYPIFSFFLTERCLYPLRRLLAEKTMAVRIDESHIIRINTRTRLLFILLAIVIVPLLALGALVYHRVSMELIAHVGNPASVQPVMSQLLALIAIVIAVVLLLTAGIVILLATSISNPLDHMIKTIRDMEKGNLRARTNLISNDEIGVLSQSFDTMALNLENSREKLEDVNKNLEFRVSEKTGNLARAYERLQISNRNLALANRELGTANRKLMEIGQLKSDFISVVSHELRTPLTSIKAFAELILMKPNMLRDRRNKLLHIINDETDRLARLINNVLDLTKIEAGKLSWHIVKLSIADIIETSVSGIQSLSDNKSLTLTTRIQHPLPLILGDRDRLIQVVTNILSNAIKFTPPGGKIAITAHYEETEKPKVVVSVSDTGVGIKSEYLDLIFEKFRRAVDVLTTYTEGTGLGLSISRQIVEYHGGAIWAQSTLGEGSTFIFTIPSNSSWNIEDRQTTLIDIVRPHDLSKM